MVKAVGLSVKVSKSFVIDLDSAKAYSDARNFFLKLGYIQQNSVEPELLVFKKNLSTQNLSTGKPENYVIRLKVSLNPLGDLQLYSTALLTIRCDYLVKIMEREVSDADKKLFEEEVVQLKKVLGGKVLSKKADVSDTESKKTPSTVGRLETPKTMILPDHISTGYDELDTLLQGGLPEKYSIIITAPPSDERELLIERFLRAGASSGEVTFYITLDSEIGKSLAKDFSNFYLFLCNQLAEECNLDLPNVFCLSGVGALSNIDIALTKSFRLLGDHETGSKRICIDLISDILLHHEAVNTRKWVNGIISELKSNGFTVLCVINSLMHTQDQVQAILGLFDGEIRLDEKETKNGIETFLRIRRMRNHKYSREEIKVTPESLEM